MTDAVVDTVALIRHLADSLPRGAEEVFRTAEAGRTQLWIPDIALGEFAYLGLRGRLGIREPRGLVEEVLSTIRAAGYIRARGLGPVGWDSFLNLEIPGLHDRMIAATALELDLPLVSNDPSFKAIDGLETLWA